MKIKQAEGPWEAKLFHVEEDGDQHWTITPISGYGMGVDGEGGYLHIQTIMHENDARLIAAAPELLVEYEQLLTLIKEASQSCLKGQSDVAEDLCHEYAGFNSPAISKAKGENK